MINPAPKYYELFKTPKLAKNFVYKHLLSHHQQLTTYKNNMYQSVCINV